MPLLDQTEIILRLVAALLAGGMVGIERTMAHKMAGLRTYALVSLGSALFVIVSIMAGAALLPGTSFDPLRVASQIVVGTGFMGAGLVFFKESKITGLTTAVGLWVAAAIGMAAGFGFYQLVLIASLLTLFVFHGLWYLEYLIKKILPEDND